MLGEIQVDISSPPITPDWHYHIPKHPLNPSPINSSTELLARVDLLSFLSDSFSPFLLQLPWFSFSLFCACATVSLTLSTLAPISLFSTETKEWSLKIKTWSESLGGESAECLERSCGLWVWVLHGAVCFQHRACFGSCPLLSALLSFTCSRALSLSLSNINIFLNK